MYGRGCTLEEGRRAREQEQSGGIENSGEPKLIIHLCCRFEAFDEPWKVRFNTDGKEWEDKWGLMDPGRTLKSGLKIPDCGGKRV